MELTNVKIGSTIVFTYTNWQGKTSNRRVKVKKFVFGSTEYHPQPQMLMVAHDLDKDTERTFAIAEITNLSIPRPPKPDIKDDIDYGKMLKEFRVKAGMTQEDMADHLHLSQNLVSRMENGSRTILLEEFLKWISVTKQKTVALERIFGKEIAEKALKQLEELGLMEKEVEKADN